MPTLQYMFLMEIFSEVFKHKCKNSRQVAHVCNPVYLGNGDQEDLSSRLAWAKS
jgi:hypothetical protein